jgi:hypothetical protein
VLKALADNGIAVLPSERAQYSAIIDKILAGSDLNTISARRIRGELEAELGLDVSDKKVSCIFFRATNLPTLQGPGYSNGNFIYCRESAAYMRYLQNAVKELIMERFDRAHNNPASLAAGKASTPSSTPQTNGYSSAHNNSNSQPKKEPRSESKVKSETPASSTPGGDYGDDSDVVSPPKKKRKHVGSSEEVDDAKLAAMLQAQENRFVAHLDLYLLRDRTTNATRGASLSTACRESFLLLIPF